MPGVHVGFLQPVDQLPALNSMKAGGAVPVKFSLGGDQGLDIFVAGYPRSEAIDCDSTASVDGIEQTVTAGGSSLQYDALADVYIYVWKTDKAWTGTAVSSCSALPMTPSSARTSSSSEHSTPPSRPIHARKSGSDETWYRIPDSNR